jgi:hypothetical protein
MASTYSSLKIELIGNGEQSGTWGTTTNLNLGTAIDEAITGRATADFPTDADLTLSYTDSNATQIFRNLILNVTSTGSLTTTRNLIVPTIEKQYLIENNTSGSQSIVVKTSAGTGVTVPNGRKMHVYANGTNVVVAFDFVNLAGGTATLSTLTVTGDGTFSGTGQVKMPVGTTAQRSGAPAAGMFRFNDDTDQFEGYDGTAWGGISGAQAGGAILTNKSTATASYTIASGENGLSGRPHHGGHGCDNNGFFRPALAGSLRSLK